MDSVKAGPDQDASSRHPGNPPPSRQGRPESENHHGQQAIRTMSFGSSTPACVAGLSVVNIDEAKPLGRLDSRPPCQPLESKFAVPGFFAEALLTNEQHSALTIWNSNNILSALSEKCR